MIISLVYIYTNALIDKELIADLRFYNIKHFVDQDMNITGVLDWETLEIMRGGRLYRGPPSRGYLRSVSYIFEFPKLDITSDMCLLCYPISGSAK